MLLPGLSVTLIGVIAGLAVGVYRRTPLRGVAHGLAAAWCGFVFGAFVGLLLDALLATDVWLTVVGHIGAVGASVFGYTLYDSPEPARS